MSHLCPTSAPGAPPHQLARERDLVKVQAGDDIRPLCQAVHLLQEVHVADVCAQVKNQVKGGEAPCRTGGSGGFP